MIFPQPLPIDTKNVPMMDETIDAAPSARG
jgi:hypothetical protein